MQTESYYPNKSVVVHDASVRKYDSVYTGRHRIIHCPRRETAQLKSEGIQDGIKSHLTRELAACYWSFETKANKKEWRKRILENARQFFSIRNHGQVVRKKKTVAAADDFDDRSHEDFLAVRRNTGGGLGNC
jgi:hypothetical protein